MKGIWKVTEFINEKLIETNSKKLYIQSQKKSKNIMSSKGFNQFKNFLNQKTSSSGGFRGFLSIAFGFGLFFLAQSSIYYGTFWLSIKLTSAITPSNSINFGVAWALTGTEKATILSSPLLKCPSFTMFKPGKMRSGLKLPIETCN